MGPRNHALDGVQIPPWEGAILRGKGRPIAVVGTANSKVSFDNAKPLQQKMSKFDLKTDAKYVANVNTVCSCKYNCNCAIYDMGMLYMHNAIFLLI